MAPDYGGQSMVAPLRRVIVRRPDPAFAVSDPRRWHYAARPDLGIAQSEHDRLVDALRSAGAKIHEHVEALPDLADAIYVHDPILITNGGAIVLRMGKELRRGEEEALERTVAGLGVPIRSRLQGAATAEGGDLLWLDESTLAAGRGFRTNAEGVSQLREELAPPYVRDQHGRPRSGRGPPSTAPGGPVGGARGARHSTGRGSRRGVPLHGSQRARPGPSPMSHAARQPDHCGAPAGRGVRGLDVQG